MRILVDACVAGFVVHALRRSGFEVEWVAEWEEDPGDRAILDRAYAAGQVLITRDKDFGELIFREDQPHCGVLRLAGEMSYIEQGRTALRIMTSHRAALERGCTVTAEPGRIRVSTHSVKH